MTKFFGIILDFTALALVVIAFYSGTETLLLFPYTLFWFNAVLIFLAVFIAKGYWKIHYKPQSKLWRTYDFISDCVFVLICFLLGWSVLGIFLLIMVVCKASKIEHTEQRIRADNQLINQFKRRFNYDR